MKSNQIKLLISIVSVIFILSGLFALSQRSQRPQELTPVSQSQTDEFKGKDIEVVANNGVFNPSDFETELFSDINLSVTAVDKDYTFEVEGYPRLTEKVKKGETKIIKIDALGIGEYTYTCSANCKGTITVGQQADSENEEED